MIVDTDVLIWYLRGDENAGKKLRRGRFSISAVTLMELVQGMRNRKELKSLKRFLSAKEVTVIPISETISDRAVYYMEKYFLSHNLRMADALIGATASMTGEKLLTGDRKHYRVLGDVETSPFRPSHRKTARSK